MRIVESPWEMARGDLTSVSALFDPAGELSMDPRTWTEGFTDLPRGSNGWNHRWRAARWNSGRQRCLVCFSCRRQLQERVGGGTS